MLWFGSKSTPAPPEAPTTAVDVPLNPAIAGDFSVPQMMTSDVASPMSLASSSPMSSPPAKRMRSLDVPTTTEPSDGTRLCSNTGRCRTPTLPDGWAWKLCRGCQLAKNETNKRNRQRKKAVEAGEEVSPRPVRRRLPRDDFSKPSAAGPSEVSLPTTSAAPYPLDPAFASSPPLGAPFYPPLPAMFQNYSYPTANSDLIRTLNLQLHPEGGYYAETDRSERNFEPDTDGSIRSFHSTIYYLLTPEHSHSYFHRHSADSLHFLHQGRARFTCLEPPSVLGQPFKLHVYTLGLDAAHGESRQVRIPGNWWRFVELLDEDMARATIDPEYIGMLMSEVCVPGFSFETHSMLRYQELQQICATPELVASFEHLKRFVKNTEALFDNIKQFVKNTEA